mmetsp:Transcript_16282/g.50541  ORF Transcript_16282/g.50541 Transcript_16282/m.50541 type:complete len:212 (+) Transcript_16282:609-1244(+)
MRNQRGEPSLSPLACSVSDRASGGAPKPLSTVTFAACSGPSGRGGPILRRANRLVQMPRSRCVSFLSSERHRPGAGGRFTLSDIDRPGAAPGGAHRVGSPGCRTGPAPRGDDTAMSTGARSLDADMVVGSSNCAVSAVARRGCTGRFSFPPRGPCASPPAARGAVATGDRTGSTDSSFAGGSMSKTLGDASPVPSSFESLDVAASAGPLAR